MSVIFLGQEVAEIIIFGSLGQGKFQERVSEIAKLQEQVLQRGSGRMLYEIR